MRAFLKHLFSNDIHPVARAKFFIAFAAFALMVGVTIAGEVQFSAKPLQVRELAGREVSMEKLADVFLGMDQMSLYGHYMSIALVNVVIFLGVLLLFIAMRDGAKK